MKALVVDDEPFARRRLIRLLETIDGIEVAGEAQDGHEALAMIERLAPDVVFLDIRMPGLDGLSLAAQHQHLPPIVFTTAYHEYAVAAFEAEAVDYLLKPIEPERLRSAVERLRRRSGSDLAGRLEAVVRRLAEPTEPPRLGARSGSSVFLFDPRDITRFRAENKYVAFIHGGTRYLLEESIQSLESRLAPWGFVRPHRGELINSRFIVALHIEGTSAALQLRGGTRVAVSRRRLAAIRAALGV